MGQGKGRRVPVEIPRIRKLRWCLTDVHWRWSDRRRCVQGNDLFPFESPPLFRSRLQQQHLLYLLLNSSLGFGRSSLKIESGIEGSRTWCRDRCLESAQGNECFLFSARTIRGIYYTYIYILSNYQHVHMLDICCPSDHFFCFFLNYYYGRTRTGYGLLAAVGRMEEECTPGKHVVTITRRSHDTMDWLRRSKILALSR